MSLALCADALGSDRLAVQVYQRFKERVIACLTGDRFELTQDQIKATVAELEAARGRGR